MQCWLIGYDVSNPKRLQRIHRLMTNWATPIEYSIFLFTGTARDLEKCLTAVNEQMNAKFDDVRCYPLPARGLQERLGRATLPEGIQWTALPSRLS